MKGKKKKLKAVRYKSAVRMTTPFTDSGFRVTIQRGRQYNGRRSVPQVTQESNSVQIKCVLENLSSDSHRTLVEN